MTSKPVLLGFPDSYTKIKDGTVNPFVTRLGGLPIGLDGLTKPPVEFSKCKNCNQIMPLILQTHAHIDHTNYDRVIYVWVCCNKYCQYREGSARVIRGVLYGKTHSHETKHSHNDLSTDHFINLGNSIFNVSGTTPLHSHNPFQMNSSVKIKQDSHTPPDLMSSNMKNFQNSHLTQNIFLSKTESEEKEWPCDDEILQYPIELLYIVEENQSLEKEFSKKLNIENLEEKFAKKEEKEWSKEVYEKPILEKGFYKFMKRINANPQQCVRYNRKGRPLYYSLTDSLAKKINLSESENLGKCQLCNSQNVFELQIMPNTINILEEKSSLGDMLWGTIIVGTCSNDCVPNLNNKGIGYAEEWIGIQWEDMRK
ncbi:hypothetical protein PORY_000679 [Pneumocystis oryctolagi]|uniref:Uncharacterized protein n=1 Tax=Pneumocystis oryctolagi TaxID=42067 RepID=A0ACB7CDE0_9ASCO|nr:hypothetical protein PORY_000679 [Pneumocystis oryctolagi]